MGKQELDVPPLSIEVTLIHYGAKSVPGGYGWKPIKCPFHNDRMASASVNTQLNGFRCHGCEVSGDPIKIIRQQEGMGFVEAVEFARSVLGASVERVPRTVSKSGKRNKLGRNKWRSILE